MRRRSRNAAPPASAATTHVGTNASRSHGWNDWSCGRLELDGISTGPKNHRAFPTRCIAAGTGSASACRTARSVKYFPTSVDVGHFPVACRTKSIASPCIVSGAKRKCDESIPRYFQPSGLFPRCRLMPPAAVQSTGSPATTRFRVNVGTAVAKNTATTTPAARSFRPGSARRAASHAANGSTSCVTGRAIAPIPSQSPVATGPCPRSALPSGPGDIDQHEPATSIAASSDTARCASRWTSTAEHATATPAIQPATGPAHRSAARAENHVAATPNATLRHSPGTSIASPKTAASGASR
ncbi:MAG: hypothetical protein HMLKMBBP_03111 [Planctomycetes bacterium]|nr:hypothetical protein [Planctomycetota bacterium]